MADRYQQFLGNRPGNVVELLDDSGSPYRVRTEDGFEFSLASEDFRNYYRRLGDQTPKRWNHLVTDPKDGFVDSRRLAKVMDIIHELELIFNDFQKARSFVREVLQEISGHESRELARIKTWLKTSGRWNEAITDEHLISLTRVDQDTKRLLLSDSLAMVPWPSVTVENGEPQEPAIKERKAAKAEKEPSRTKASTTPRRLAMKNVEMAVEGDILTLTVDLDKDLGPSKSGKTIMVASSEGAKTIPGRDERMGLNVYRQEGKKPAKGRRTSFKNVTMAVDEAILKITVDLSQELGPSKSGKTTMIASTGGNQLVPGRSEKVGLNVYRKLD